MIKEAYCSEGVYKLLREKGFEGEIHTFYDKDGYTTPVITHQMAMAWIVEKYNVSIEISALKHNCWVYTIYKILDDKVKEIYNDGEFKFYEETVEAALKYVSENLI